MSCSVYEFGGVGTIVLWWFRVEKCAGSGRSVNVLCLVCSENDKLGMYNVLC